MPKRLVLILNPTAGTKQGKRYLADLISLFEEYDYECLSFVTRARSDATRIAAAYAPQADLLVTVGGDGTFNETLCGLIEAGCPCPVGYLPAGSTNDLGTSLGLSRNLLQCARSILEGQPAGLDVGCFDGRYFTYVASFGAFTRASYAAPQNLKNLLGHLAYLLEGIKDLLAIKTEHLRIETDDGSMEGDYIFGAISNSTSMGGVLTLDQSLVSLNDGLFELLLIRNPKSVAELTQIITALTSQDYNCELLEFHSVRKAHIFCSPDMPWSLDGEFQPGKAELTVENLRRKVQILLPASSDATAE